MPAVPRHAPPNHAHRRRRPRARFALLGLAAAGALVLALPAIWPHAAVVSPGTAGAAPAAIAQPPTDAPAEASAADARSVVVTGAPMAHERDADVARPVRAGRPSIDALSGYEWPIARPRLTLPFGPSPWGSRIVDGEWFHDGIDLATFCGDRIRATHDGVVLAAGRRYDDAMGWLGDLRPYLNRIERKHLWMALPIVVVIDDGNGYRSLYAHFSKVVVKKGDTVSAGDLLGFEGMTGRASGCHLHYGLFAPEDTGVFRIRPDVVKRMKVPKAQVARVDPLLVLPPRRGLNAPRR
jgi:murein DD-endopeptidase MepM/ murein hydrolase activator NlpD